MNRDERVTQLPMRSRETFDGDGGIARTDTVMCPSRAMSVEIDDCLRCGYCARPPADDERSLGCVHPAARKMAVVRPPVLADIMTRAVVCVRSDLAVESLATLLLERNISAVPVVDTVGRPVGLASKTDLVRWYHDESTFGEAAMDRDAPVEPGLSTRDVRTTTVADVMMPLAFTLYEDAPLAYAAALMTVEGIHHLPIVSKTGTVVGIVSALDLVRCWIARESQEAR